MSEQPLSDRAIWKTAQQFADLNLRGLPRSKRGMIVYLRREGGTSIERLMRKRQAVGGGFEYHYMALPPEAIVDYETRFSLVPPALDAVALRGGKFRGGTSVIETAEGGKLFAFIRRTHLIQPDASAAAIRRLCVDEFGESVIGLAIETGAIAQVEMPPLSAFQRILSDVRAYYALGATTRRAGFDRVFDRFARAKLCVALGESEVLKLEEQIRALTDPKPAAKPRRSR
ncbi:hypothetical protein ATN81_03085 [Agrobacterium pusense]|uniref:hypothetical protein n=1 Tax=Agrobacterium pusense TaxID=648995 RepID=UPI000927BC19|nr:hypothetical protein [Agrobacterium pusense]OJH51166.1 hypothetical protein ATN81_03085 [Agrobacterium pusense]OJH56019.1 hypothetical protein BA725_03935 [Agrobacterium pusense]